MPDRSAQKAIAAYQPEIVGLVGLSTSQFENTRRHRRVNPNGASGLQRFY